VRLEKLFKECRSMDLETHVGHCRKLKEESHNLISLFFLYYPVDMRIGKAKHSM
jgi:hypothetical protein